MDCGRGKGGARKKMFLWDKLGPRRRWGWVEDIPTYKSNSMKIVPMLLNLFKEKEMSNVSLHVKDLQALKDGIYN
jgi:hypothetical protein